jgi:DNA-binding transcriptional LysR family regulator
VGGQEGPFRVGYVTGATPYRWARTWRERRPLDPLELVSIEHAEQESGVRAGLLDMALVREPLERSGLHLIQLYEETPVVVVPGDHVATAYDEVPLVDLADERFVLPAPPQLALRAEQPALPARSEREAVELVAAGAGIAVMPLSLARLYHRRDVTHRPVLGLDSTRVGLCWLVENDDIRVQVFIGIVRGRSERSSRG